MRRKLVAPLTALAFTALALWLLPAPFLWSAVAWALALAFGATRARASFVRGACVSVAVLALGFAAAEALLWRRAVRDAVPECAQEAEYPEGYFEPYHEVLGYAPAPGRTTRSRKVCDGELVYDVEYTIDARGLRVSPPSEAAEAVVFFGCSFTFGEGVRDEETLPYRFGLRSAERVRVDNFGFQGYGPHQMLRALECGLVEELVPARPIAFVYQLILIHARRSAGMEPWDEHGPRYVLREGGGVELTGRFSDFAASPALAWLAGKSYLYQRLSGRTGARELELAAAIVAAARDEVARRFPEASFHVLYWDEARAKSDALEAALRAHDIAVLRVGDVLTGARADDRRWILSDKDMHPSAAAHDLLAEHLVEVVLDAGTWEE